MSKQRKLPKKLVWEFKTKIYDVERKSYQNSERYVIREESYRIFINGKKFTSVMLVPEYEKEFFYGFLFTSQLIDSAKDIKSFRMCENKNAYVFLEEYKEFSFENKWTVTSGCGGGKVLEKTYDGFEKIETDFKVDADKIIDMYKMLEKESYLHSHTRCVHKSYFLGKDGFVFTCEDIGRHNTIDKTIGAIMLNKRSYDGVILTTGRLTSEMVLKCARAKIPIVVSRTAPSKMGIDIAKDANVTLIGLTSTKGFTVFTNDFRINFN
ncbi:formate dehydrogenase accessory sulfurtransferase FdhD [Deferribacter abyssi]|uniref:formate dehydrogenase accessory sulfurtransferase FdhD n=1 Tax=Deferribacter abyssi TaxID=213806 RepID=UPI003C214D0C